MAEFATLQHATYTEAEWTAWDGVLLEGQMAYSSDVLYSGTDQMRHKVGNGTDTWTALDYVPEPIGFTGGNLTSAINEAKGSDIASASTTDIGAATGNFVHVTGTTTITALGTVQAGTRRIVRFSGALILTHNATSLILPTGANITTAANDVATFVSEGSGNWRCVNYMRANGTPLAGVLYSQDDLLKKGSTTFDLRYSTNATAFNPTTQAFGKDTMHAMPFICGQTMTFDRIGIEITAAGTAASVCRLLIYDVINGVPTNLILDAGTIAADSATYQEITINQTLQAGLYALVAWHNSTGTPSARAIPIAACNKVLGISSTIGSGATNTKWTNSYTYTTAPSTYPSPTATNPQTPLITLRRSA